MTDYYRGRTVLVTGASSGIGADMARRLGALGAHTLLAARSDDALAAVAADVEAAGGTAAVFPIDLEPQGAAAALVGAVAEAGWTVDVLVNNAGFGIFKPISEMSVDEWRSQIDVNLAGVFYLSKAALPHLSASGDGFIVNIGSLAGRNSFAGGTGYNASKFGLVGLSEASNPTAQW